MRTTIPLVLFLLTLFLGGCGSQDAGGANNIFPTPLTVLLSSYANKNDSRLSNVQIKSIRNQPNITTFEATEVDSNAISLTFGDFYQDGQLSAFVVVKRTVDGTALGAPIGGKVYFLRWKNAQWVDETSTILANRTACINNQYAITADFNNDGKPDVFLSCGSNATEEEQLVFLSGQSGAYTRTTTGMLLKGSKAAALDIDADGNMDVIVANKLGTTNPASPHFWRGNGKGAFTKDTSLITSGAPCDPLPSDIDQVFIVPTVLGRNDLVLSGTAVLGGTPQVWLRKQTTSPYYTTCNNNYSNFPAIALNGTSATMTDMVYTNGTFYANMMATNASSMKVAKYAIANNGITLSNADTFATNALPADGSGLPPLFKLDSNNNFVVYDAGCANTTRCTFSTPIQ